jgi:uncharacterized membrane protein/uncharacterized protein YegL
VSVASYWPLLLVLIVPGLWWARARTRTDLSERHLVLLTILRSVVICLLAGALIQPVWTREGRWLSVVYVLDVSESIAPQAIASAIRWISDTEAAGEADHSRFIPFASNALVLQDLDALGEVQIGPVDASGSIDQRGTDLAMALDLASRSFAADHLRRIVLLTDGNENEGSVRALLPGLQQAGIEVDTLPLDSRHGPDSWIEDVRVPATVAEDELFPVDVHVYSQGQSRATITLGDGETGEIRETREVALDAGINRIGFEIRSATPGTLTLEATLDSAEDRFPGNNLFRQALAVAGPPRVLYVESRPESAVYLRNALQLETIETDVIGPGEVPERADQFDAYEAVILSDVRADAMTGEQMEALATYVSDLGGGFILVGGESVYGEDGYSNTRIEQILPVRFDLEREPPTVSLIIVLDKSGSMGGQKLELVKEASKAAVGVLRDDQHIGLVAFDYNHYWPFRLQPAANRESINQNISTIVAGGETNIYPALREAHLALMEVDSEIKHVILLSDGRSLPDDFRTLVEEMVEAGETVSTVAVGNGADRELLADIAAWGRGRDYFIEDATRVPQVFTEETELATRGTLREDAFRPVLLKDVEALRGIDFAGGPPLLGYVATISRETSEVLLVSGEGEDADPILARWQYGLGKTVAFTSDVKDRWAVEWLGWDGYAKLWPQLVRETMRRGESGDLDLEIEREGRAARVRVTSYDRQGGFGTGPDPDLRVVDPDGNPVAADLHASGPGTWQARFDLETDGNYVVTVGSLTERASRTLAYSYPEEYHLYPPDRDLLAEISRVTGGRFDPAAGQVFDTGEETTHRSVPLWPYLASIALILYLADLLLRRVRLFDPAPERGPGAEA